MADLPPTAQLPEATERPLPPLRIHHFFLWTIAVAAVVVLSTAFRNPGPSPIALVEANLFIALVASAIAVTTLLLGLYWRRQGLPFFAEPGHWLLIAVTLDLLMHGWQSIVQWNESFFGFPAGYWSMFAFHQAPNTIAAILYFIAARRGNWDKAWRRFFNVAMACNLLTVLWSTVLVLVDQFVIAFQPSIDSMIYLVVGLFFLLLLLLPVVMCLIAILQDTRRVGRRHWSHWCGVMIWLSLIVLHIGFSVYSTMQMLR